MSKKNVLAALVMVLALYVAPVSTVSLFASPLVDDTDAGASVIISRLQDRQSSVRRALRVLDQTFALPATARPLRVRLADLQDGLNGFYIVDESDDRALSVSSRFPDGVKYVPGAGMVTLHETGHWFDNCVLAPALYGGRTPARAMATSRLNSPSLAPALSVQNAVLQADLAAWWNAVRASRTYSGLQFLANSPRAQKEKELAAYVGYVSSPAEMWARSFAQYVAQKSGDDVLQKELSGVVVSSWPLCGHWNQQDFAPIAAAMDQIFQHQNWLRSIPAGQTPPAGSTPGAPVVGDTPHE